MPGVDVLGPIPAQLADWSEVLLASDARGAIRILRGPKGRLVSQVVGHFSAEFGAKSHAITLAEIADGRSVSIFAEWSRMTGYDAASRRLLTDMVLTHRASITEVCVFTLSTMVALGVNTAGLATALVGVPVTSTTDRSGFFARVLAP
jgi:hypothetical protein